MRFLLRLYPYFGALILAGYLGSALVGWEFTSARREKLPASAQSPGGYRGFHFWHSGYQGGK